MNTDIAIRLNEKIRLIIGLLIAMTTASGLWVATAYVFPANSQVYTTASSNAGMVNECGFATICGADNPSGLALALSINTTSVKSNGSLSFVITLVNPTIRYINMSSSDTWYLRNLPGFSWVCYDGSIPYAFGVFRGHYTLVNVSSAENVLHPDAYPSCLSPISHSGNKTGFSIPPLTTLGRPYLSHS